MGQQQQLSRPPDHVPVLDSDGTHAKSWSDWFTAMQTTIVQGRTQVPAPASSIATGVPFQIAADANFLYVCVGNNRWKRIPLQAF